MRIVGLASIVNAVIVGFALASPAQAFVKKDTHIPPQQLGSALRELAKEHQFQVFFRSDVVGQRTTNGVSGQLTTDEAIKRLLSGTGLTYEYMDDHTVAIVAPSPDTTSSYRDSGVTGEILDQDHQQQERQKGSLWDRFRVAQATQGASAETTSVAGNRQATQTEPVSLQEVVVTAQKKGEERLQDVPVPVAVINADELLNYNETRVQDFFSTVPGMNFAPTGAQAVDTLSIRGITTGIGTNPTVGVLIDDVPFGAITNTSAGNDVPDIDPNDLARVEVLRGPQGTLYGASSMGGLLKFVTKDPSLESASGNVSAGISSVSHGAEPGYNFRASGNMPLSDGWAIRASAFTRDDPGYIDNPFSGAKGINEDHAYGAHIAALWRPSDSVSLKLSALFQDIRADGSSDINSGPGYANSLGDLQQNYLPGVGGYDRSAQAYSATLTAKFGGVDFTSVTGFSVIQYRDSWDFTPEFGDQTQKQFDVQGTPVTDSAVTRKVTQEIRLSGSLVQNIDWLLGGFFDHEHSTGIEDILAEATTGKVVGTWANWFFARTNQEEAAFANITYRFSDQFDVQLGARESHIVVTTNPTIQLGVFDTVFGTPALVPELSASANVFTYLVTPRIKLSPDLMVYARLASGYRPGAANGVVVTTYPRQSDPDQTKNYELGVKGDFIDHKLSIDASLYYIDWKNIQEAITDPKTGFGYTGNVSGAKSEGAELSVTLKPLPGLSISSWVSYDDAVLTDAFPPGSNGYGLPGTKLPFTARWSGNLSLEQDFPMSSSLTGFVGSQVRVIGERLGQFAPSATAYRQIYPSYTELDVRTGAKYGSWTVNLYLNNAGDKRGLIGGGTGSFPPIGFEYITPRTVGLTLSKLF